MSVRCVPVSGAETAKLVPILHDAEEDDERIRTAMRAPACQTYAALVDEQAVGAAVVRWGEPEPAEILYLAVVAGERGNGYGRQIVAAIQAELPAHGRTLLVGTANSALDNIAFYQKCGFRMHAVKPDYFTYIQPPLREHGIVMRDMIVFAYDLGVMPPLAYPVVLASPTAGEPQALAPEVPVPHRLDGRPPFCDVALAEGIERVEAQLITESSEASRRRRPGATGFAAPLAGGVASFADEGSPLNKVAGLGFAGAPEAADLDEVERAFAACGAPVQVELAHLADPTVPTASPTPTRRGCPRTRTSRARCSWTPCATWQRPVFDVTSRCVTGRSPAAPACVRPTASRSSPARRRRPRTGVAACSRRCWPPGSPTRSPPAATSRSSPPNPAPRPSRTRSARDSTCSTHGPCW